MKKVFNEKEIDALKLSFSRVSNCTFVSVKHLVVVITFIDEFSLYKYVCYASVSFCKRLVAQNRVSDIVRSELNFMLN